ncbi:hypothetical protein [Streptomyces sp. G1]|uniref:hypothetical protein n=1 Tax=Streptomyces sp. G1 TaxID=361572 RepID=UPI00202FF9DF|nr:hypothetical protein [Streptomyces sp. G1]MCM1972347.1 hypothetical protein [Streptomyces sp. G1]
MIRDYDSDALVVIDGEEVPVHVRFGIYTDGLLKEWHGVIGADEPGLAFKLVAARRTVLRMPDGKEAPIVPGGHSSEEGIPFTGSGPAPV